MCIFIDMMLDSSEDEYGISPVVGVILMVAIVVVLSTIVGFILLDLGGSVNQTAKAGLTMDKQMKG